MRPFLWDGKADKKSQKAANSFGSFFSFFRNIPYFCCPFTPPMGGDNGEAQKARMVR
jgi:hypothetical protein